MPSLPNQTVFQPKSSSSSLESSATDRFEKMRIGAERRKHLMQLKKQAKKGKNSDKATDRDNIETAITTIEDMMLQECLGRGKFGIIAESVEGRDWVKEVLMKSGQHEKCEVVWRGDIKSPVKFKVSDDAHAFATFFKNLEMAEKMKIGRLRTKKVEATLKNEISEIPPTIPIIPFQHLKDELMTMYKRDANQSSTVSPLFTICKFMDRALRIGCSREMLHNMMADVAMECANGWESTKKLVPSIDFRGLKGLEKAVRGKRMARRLKKDSKESTSEIPKKEKTQKSEEGESEKTYDLNQGISKASDQKIDLPSSSKDSKLVDQKEKMIQEPEMSQELPKVPNQDVQKIPQVSKSADAEKKKEMNQAEGRPQGLPKLPQKRLDMMKFVKISSVSTQRIQQHSGVSTAKVAQSKIELQVPKESSRGTSKDLMSNCSTQKVDPQKSEELQNGQNLLKASEHSNAEIVELTEIQGSQRLKNISRSSNLTIESQTSTEAVNTSEGAQPLQNLQEAAPEVSKMEVPQKKMVQVAGSSMISNQRSTKKPNQKVESQRSVETSEPSPTSSTSRIEEKAPITALVSLEDGKNRRPAEIKRRPEESLEHQKPLNTSKGSEKHQNLQKAPELSESVNSKVQEIQGPTPESTGSLKLQNSPKGGSSTPKLSSDDSKSVATGKNGGSKVPNEVNKRASKNSNCSKDPTPTSNKSTTVPSSIDTTDYRTKFLNASEHCRKAQEALKLSEKKAERYEKKAKRTDELERKMKEMEKEMKSIERKLVTHTQQAEEIERLKVKISRKEDVEKTLREDMKELSLKNQLLEQELSTLKIEATTSKNAPECGVSDTDCLICHDYREPNEKTVECVTCHKVYHLECFEQWFEKKETCPHCLEKFKNIEGILKKEKKKTNCWGLPID